MHCIICDKPTQVLRHPKFPSTYHACAGCGFISKDSADHPTADEEFRVYENHENSLEDPRYVDFFEKFLHAAVFPFTNNGREAFDFGSGPSPVLAQLMERDYDYDYTIYDKFYAPSQAYVGHKFDLVTTTEVMEHITNPIPIFNELRELLAADGILGSDDPFSTRGYF